MAIDVFSWLQSWYERHCNGEWEHRYGVSIYTLDNPGWGVKIDLTGTELDGGIMPEVGSVEGAMASSEAGDRNWLHCHVRDNQFQGHGGPLELAAILEVFQNWASSAGA